VNSLSVALTAEGASEKQSSLKARLRNGLTYLLTYLLILSELLLLCIPLNMLSKLTISSLLFTHPSSSRPHQRLRFYLDTGAQYYYYYYHYYYRTYLVEINQLIDAGV